MTAPSPHTTPPFWQLAKQRSASSPCQRRVKGVPSTPVCQKLKASRPDFLCRLAPPASFRSQASTLVLPRKLRCARFISLVSLIALVRGRDPCRPVPARRSETLTSYMPSGQARWRRYYYSSHSLSNPSSLDVILLITAYHCLQR